MQRVGVRVPRPIAIALAGSLFLCTALCTAIPPTVATAAGPDGETDSLSSALAIQDADAGARARVLILLNEERARNGLGPLVEDPTLDAAAQSYVTVLTDDACFGHTCGGQPNFTTRDAQAGYDPWTWLGENLAAGQPTPEEVFDAWMSSQLHRENILRPQFTDAGIGIAHGGLHGTYWAGEFGARPE